MKKIIFGLISLTLIIPVLARAQSIFDLPKKVEDIRDGLTGQGKQILQDSANEAVDTAKEGAKEAINEQVGKAEQVAKEQAVGYWQKIKKSLQKIFFVIENRWNYGVEKIKHKFKSFWNWLDE